MSDQKYVCIRDCYYIGNRFRPGDILPDWASPNKHFQAVGQPLPKDTQKPIYAPGDDTRSTKQLISDLKEKFDVDATGKTRKEAFRLWKEHAAAAEDSARQDANASGGVVTSGPFPGADAPGIAPGDVGRGVFKNPVLNKQFSEMTPDEIDKLTTDEICQKLKAPPYSRQDANPGPGMTKARLIKMGIDYEEFQTVR